jgi:quinol monooxygenase YgiN
MFISILTGHVSDENDEILKSRFAQELRHPPQGLLQTFLIQSQDAPRHWQIISVWCSPEAYEQAHSEKVTEVCVQMFCDAGSTPERTTFHVVGNYTRMV